MRIGENTISKSYWQLAGAAPRQKGGAGKPKPRISTLKVSKQSADPSKHLPSTHQRVQLGVFAAVYTCLLKNVNVLVT